MGPAWLLAVALALSVSLAAVPAGCARSAEKAPARTVRVVGRGSALAAPDRAEVRVTAAGAAKTQRAALSDALKAVGTVRKALLAAGAKEGELKTGRVRMDPTRVWEGTADLVTGYRATVIVTLSTKDLAGLERLMSAAADADALRIDGPVWRVDKENPARQAVVRSAIADARSRASLMASETAAELGPVVSITELSIQEPDYTAWGGARAGEVRGAGSIPPVVPNKEPLTATVQVTWELR